MMEFKISRDKLLQPLQMVMGVVEKRHTLPILSHVLLNITGKQLTVTASDMELEMISEAVLDSSSKDGQVIVPARKLLDICRSLPDQTDLNFKLEDSKLILKAGRGRYGLSCMPTGDFPNVEEDQVELEFSISQQKLKQLLDLTHFAMAQQDVRYYMNGMYWSVANEKLTVVTMDGHRLASAHESIVTKQAGEASLIVPRKGVMELQRLLEDSEENVLVNISKNHIKIKTESFTFLSKLIEGNFPDYQILLRNIGQKTFTANRLGLKQILTPISILTSDMFHAIRLQLIDNLLKIKVNNPDSEEAEDELEIDYQGEEICLGFNVMYLIDVLNTISDDTVKFHFSDSEKSVMIESLSDEKVSYIIMPLRL